MSSYGGYGYTTPYVSSYYSSYYAPTYSTYPATSYYYSPGTSYYYSPGYDRSFSRRGAIRLSRLPMTPRRTDRLDRPCSRTLRRGRGRVGLIPSDFLPLPLPSSPPSAGRLLPPTANRGDC